MKYALTNNNTAWICRCCKNCWCFHNTHLATLNVFHEFSKRKNAITAFTRLLAALECKQHKMD